jgi:hypothetical protein
MSFSDEQMVNFYVNLMLTKSYPCDLVGKILILLMIMWVVNFSIVVAMWLSLRGRVRTRWSIDRPILLNDLINNLLSLSH